MTTHRGVPARSAGPARKAVNELLVATVIARRRAKAPTLGANRCWWRALGPARRRDHRGGCRGLGAPTGRVAYMRLHASGRARVRRVGEVGTEFGKSPGRFRRRSCLRADVTDASLRARPSYACARMCASTEHHAVAVCRRCTRGALERSPSAIDVRACATDWACGRQRFGGAPMCTVSRRRAVRDHSRRILMRDSRNRR